MKRPIIFIAGRPFIRPQTGLEMRTRLTFDLLTRSGADQPRWLFVPVMKKEQVAEYAAFGWKVVPMAVEGATAPAKLKRIGSLLAARLQGDPYAEILRIRGGSSTVPIAIFRSILQSQPNALVWVYRTDYLGLLRWRTHNQRWVVDTNDSLVHLQENYGWNCLTHRLLWRTSGQLRAELLAGERRWTPFADLVIAISPKDKAHFGQFLPRHRLVLFDSCVAKRDERLGTRRNFKIGFLGSDHQGSVDAVLKLAELVKKGVIRGGDVAVGGRCAEHLPKHTPGIVNVGRVEKSESFWSSVHTAVMPLPQPTGISVKLQEAVVCGCRVLYPRGSPAWSKAREGVHVFGFSSDDELTRVLQHQWPNISASSYDCMRPDALSIELADLLAGVDEKAEAGALSHRVPSLK